MSERKKLIEQAEDILDKWEFFYGQRAGRELWAEKPEEVKNADIEAFLRDLAVVRSVVTDNNDGSKWIPVSERLPDWRDGKVLVSTKYGMSICERTVNGRWKGQHANWITHWMPLPEPPRED